MPNLNSIRLSDIVIGQEAICPGGLGRVIAYSDKFPHQWVQVSTYVNDCQCKWAICNVRLVPIPTHVTIWDDHYNER